MRNVVLPSGPRDAKIVIVGEAPGRQEELTGVPFNGPSGDMLFGDWLARVGIQRQQCLITNTYWERPDGPYDGIPDPTKYHQELTELINEHPRNIIVAVGEHALQFLTGQASITKWRGSLLVDLPGWPCSIIPIIHPAAVMRMQPWKPLCRYDAAKIRMLADKPDLRPPVHTTIHFHELIRQGTIEQAFDRLMTELDTYRQASCICFDIETYNHTITCIGLARSTDHAVVIPLTGEFQSGRTVQLLKQVRDVLQTDMPKIGQNLDYDVQYLAKCYDIGVRNVWLDTMVGHSVMHPELSHSLQTLTSIYTLQPYYKDMRKESFSPNASETRDLYNGIDCCITYEVGLKIFGELQTTGVHDMCFTLAMPVTKTLVRMEHRGIRIDHDKRTERAAKLETDIAVLMQLPALAGTNPNSTQQVQKWLTEHLPKILTKSLHSSDVHSLKLLRNKIIRSNISANTQVEACQFIDAVLKVRELRKIVSTYLKAETGQDGRMHTTYRTSVTDTGRISSTADVFGYGMNLQNVPSAQRDWFIPDPDLVFWEADASQIEARFTAYIAKDVQYIAGFAEGRDIHCENAIGLFKLSMPPGIDCRRCQRMCQHFGKPSCPTRTDIRGSHYTYRDVGKRATHAMNYKIGPRKLMELMNEYVPEYPFNEHDANEFIETFKRLRPGVARWWNHIVQHLRASRRVVTPYGRQRYFLGYWGDDLHRTAIAFVPQSCAADHINSALIRIETRLASIPCANLLLQVHDSIGGQCHPDDLEAVAAIVCEEMERPAPLAFNGNSLVIPAEFASGPTWKDCK